VAEKRLHRHGCRKCYKTYEDACDEPKENEFCYLCATGRPGLYDRLGTWAPGECCFEHCRPPRKNKLKSGDEYSTYTLSPGCPWWICDRCKRTFPYEKPRRPEPAANQEGTS
jgi:hypothetical protein